MAFLTIKDKEFEGKCTFKFDRLADEKYDEEDAKGNKTGGFMSIYMNLLQRTHNKYLVAFWVCALAHLGKEKPTEAQIEEAIEARIEEEGDAESLFKETFNLVDESGFFKIQVKNFWKNLEFLKDMGKEEKEKAENMKMYNMMKSARDELKA